jgi:hypothetical protein
MLTNVTYNWMKPTENDLQLEIRGKKDNGTAAIYNKPVALELQVNPEAYDIFESEVTSIRSEIFSRYCRAGKLSKAQHLLKRGLCDVHRRGESGEGWTPLMHACYNGHLPVVEWLVDTLKSDINAECTLDGYSPMHCAAAGGHEDITAYLIDHLGAFFVTTKALETPLSLALFNGKIDAIGKMLAPGTNLCDALVSSHGIRNKNYVGMYNVLPPFNAEAASRPRSRSPRIRSRTPSPTQMALVAPSPKNTGRTESPLNNSSSSRASLSPKSGSVHTKKQHH